MSLAREGVPGFLRDLERWGRALHGRVTLIDISGAVLADTEAGVQFAVPASTLPAALIELARRIMGGEPTKQAAQKSDGLLGRLSNLRMPGAGISTAAVQPGASKVNMVGWSSSK